MATMKLEVVTPTGRVLSEVVDSVTAPGVLGEFSVLPYHQPALIRLGGGMLQFTGKNGGAVFIRGGLAEVRADSVLVLADEARTLEQADRKAAEAILESVSEAKKQSEFLTDENAQRLNDERAYAEAMLRSAGH